MEAKPFPDVPPLDPAAFQAVAGLVYRHTGIRLAQGKEYFVAGRLGKLLRDLGCSRWEELPERVAASPSSVRDALIQAVVTPETRFFRDEVPFEALREHIAPELCRGRPRPARLRVWSAGCSTGQEPYSIIMCLWDAVESGQIDLEVVGTDISRAALARAREGVYEPWELQRGLDAGRMARYFEPAGCGRARVRPELRARVRFHRANLVSDPPPPGGFQVVFCRNVGIYFDRESKRRLLTGLVRALTPGGYLFLGGTESLYPPFPGLRSVRLGRALCYRNEREEAP